VTIFFCSGFLKAWILEGVQVLFSKLGPEIPEDLLRHQFGGELRHRDGEQAQKKKKDSEDTEAPYSSTKETI
jgi:hypothetical protein